MKLTNFTNLYWTSIASFALICIMYIFLRLNIYICIFLILINIESIHIRKDKHFRKGYKVGYTALRMISIALLTYYQFIVDFALGGIWLITILVVPVIFELVLSLISLSTKMIILRLEDKNKSK